MYDDYDESCSDCQDCRSGCVWESHEDQAFHGLLKNVSQVFGANVSIFDLPKLYNPIIPTTSMKSVATPTYTLCNMERRTTLLVSNVEMMIAGDLDDCSKLWNDFISNNGPKNPYMILDDQYLSKCSHGIGKVAGYV